MSKFSIIYLLIVFMPHFVYYKKKHLHLSLQIAALRGIIAPSWFWKKTLYHLKTYLQNANFPIFYFSNIKYIIPTDIIYIKQILELTPSVFQPQRYHYPFFKKFIGYNVDTVSGCPWKSQRVLNEKVLIKNYLRKYATYYNQTIQQFLQQSIPQNYDDFKQLSKQIMCKIIFNKNNIPTKVCHFLLQPNKILNTSKMSEKSINNIRVFILNELHFSKPLSLLSLCKDTHFTKDELIEIIPPWIFPIASLIHTLIPRILTYIIHHHKMEFVKKELRVLDLTDVDAICETTYLKQCILETLRLNCPTSSTIRILSKPFTYNQGNTFYKNNLFILLNNEILHHKECFDNPHQFIPERWTEKKEEMYSSLLFNQGPHHCPWKHIAIFIMSSFIAHYLDQANVLTGENTIVSQTQCEPMMNPRKIHFSFRSYRK